VAELGIDEWTVCWTPIHGPWSERDSAGDVLVARLGDEAYWDRRYAMTGGCCYRSRHVADDGSPVPLQTKIMMLFIDFHTLVVRDGIDPEKAHREFLKIDECRRRISPDKPVPVCATRCMRLRIVPGASGVVCTTTSHLDLFHSPNSRTSYGRLGLPRGPCGRRGLARAKKADEAISGPSLKAPGPLMSICKNLTRKTPPGPAGRCCVSCRLAWPVTRPSHGCHSNPSQRGQCPRRELIPG
jgi:hypothetical protein